MLSLLTAQEVELLATLLARAGVNPYETIWANSIMDRLRALADAQPALNTGGDDDDKPTSQPGL